MQRTESGIELRGGGMAPGSATVGGWGPRRAVVAPLAIVALLLCLFFMHAFGHEDRGPSPAPAAAAPPVAAAAHGASATAVQAVRMPDGQAGHVSMQQPADTTHRGDACGAGCGQHDFAQIACALVLLAAGTFALLFPPRLLTADHRLRFEALLHLAARVRAGPRPRTPAPQDLSISRT